MWKEPLAVALILAIAIIALLVVPAGSISLSVQPKGSVREDTPKAVVAPAPQPNAPEVSAG